MPQATRQQPQALCLRDEAHKGLGRVTAGSRTKVSACRGWGGQSLTGLRETTGTPCSDLPRGGELLVGGAVSPLNSWHPLGIGLSFRYSKLMNEGANKGKQQLLREKKKKLSGENGHTSREVWSLPCAYKPEWMPESTLLSGWLESLRTQSSTNKSIAGLSAEINTGWGKPDRELEKPKCSTSPGEWAAPSSLTFSSCLPRRAQLPQKPPNAPA